MQWNSYIGVLESESVYFQLAFVDVDRDSRTSATPAFNEPTLITEEGPLSVTVDAVVPSRAIGPRRPFTLLGRLEPLPVGSYRWSRIEYVDESGRPRRLDVGSWRLDVRRGSIGDLREMGSTVGATSFGYLEVVLQNGRSESVVLDGLEMDPPDIGGSAVVTARPAPSPVEAPLSSGTGPPASAVASGIGLPLPVTVEPGEQMVISATLSSGADRDALAFVQLKPFLRYRVAGEPGSRLYALPLQVYSSPLSGQWLDDYLTSLPSGAWYAP